jgi:surface protein
MSLEASRLRRLATKAQTYVVLSCLKQLFKDVILVILEYVEFARPDISPKLVNDRNSPFDIYNAVMRWRNDPVAAMKVFGHISDWDTSEVTCTERLFESFVFGEFDIISEWEMGRVKSMSSMFHRASSFNQPLERWEVSNVTDMRHMFYGASSFN